jgi:lipoprotein signal peptidase
MRALLAGVVLIPVLDQLIKTAVLQTLRQQSLPLGPLGRLHATRGRLWIARGAARPSMGVLWTLWIVAAAALVAITVRAPSSGVFAGLLLGGSLSHLVETSRRGWICDFICLRFWPAFNLADVALTAGAIGMVLRLWRSDWGG